MLKIIGIVLLLCATVAHANPGTAAEEAIPFHSLTESNRTLLQGVTAHYTLRRVYAVQEFPARQAHLEWMLDNLNATWALASACGLPARTTKLDEQGRMWTDDGDGSKGYVAAIHQIPGKRVYYMEGSQQKFCTVRGRGVIVIDYVATPTNTVRCSGVQFIKVDQVIMAALTQLFRPFLTGLVDSAYKELLNPLRELCNVAMTQPAKLREIMESRPAEEQRQWQGLERLLAQPGPAP